MTHSILSGQYDWKLVALSVSIAIFSAYTALDLAGRTAYSRGPVRTAWLIGGASSMGLGIWAMHYIGMLAFRLPLPVSYNVPIVVFSLLAAIGSSGVALLVVSGKELGRTNLFVGSVAMGGGIAAMHYSGMMAMRIAAHPIYNPWIVALSVGIAVAVSYAALTISFRLRDRTKNPGWIRLASATIMGSAIAAMHYTGMAAVCFHHAEMAVPLGNSVSVSTLGITGITAVTLLVLAVSLVGSLADHHFSVQRGMLQSEQERWRLVIASNQDGIFDIDLVTGKTFHSPRWNAILGYGPDEIVTKAEWQERLHPEDRPVVDSTVNEYLRSRSGSKQVEYRLRHRDGHWLWILAQFQAVWDPEGRPLRLVGSISDMTLRKQAVAELEASESRFAAFMHHSPAMAYIKDAEGRILYTNQALERAWGLGRGEWIGKLDAEVFSGINAQDRERDLAVLASDTPQEFTEASQMPDGSARQLLITQFSFPDASGSRVIGSVAIDITERVRSEEKLRQSEARYREMFERNPLPSWIYSLDDLRILDVNHAAIDQYGWTREEFAGLSLRDIRMPDEVDEIEAELIRCSAERALTKPLRHRRKDKSVIWVELSSNEVSECDCPARRIVAHDVTARIEAEKEIKRAHDQLESLIEQRTDQLHSSEAKWRSLVEALPQMVWSTGPDGRCDYMSYQWIEYTGFPLDEHLGDGWLNFLHPADQARGRAAWQACCESGERYDVEYRIRAKDGTYRWFKARGGPVRATEDGPITHWLGTSTDIDDQKRSEERLQAGISERTFALEEARDRAESAAQAKSSFLAAMSHEIRTPMNGVIGMTQLLMDTPLTSEQSIFVDTIRSSGEALLCIINDVLDFSKIEAGKMLLEAVEFDLQTVLEESLELVAAHAAAKQLHLSLEVADTVPFAAVGDAGRLRQILLNLLSNAVKFTEEGSISLSVSRDAVQDQVMMLRFTVRDTGIGLSTEQQIGLFQAFTQADHSTTRRFGGTGLGLSIAKRLVELMGGSIGVSSQIGQGSVFWFNICLKTGTAPESGIPNNGRVLLVDDNPRSRGAVRHYLERAGLQVIEQSPQSNEFDEYASNGGLPPLPLSLLIVDAVSLGSVAELQALRALPYLATCPTIILGTSTDWQLSSSAARLERSQYLPKPVRCMPLLRALQVAFQDSPATDPGEDTKTPEGEKERVEILVVEDNRVNQMIAKLMLEKLGCQVEIARNGLEACSAMERRSYDLVFMDCQMPEMDGFEATRIIRQREMGSRRTPIIALTAGVLQEERDQCYAAGMDDFLSKPLGKTELEAALENWRSLGREHASSPPNAQAS